MVAANAAILTMTITFYGLFYVQSMAGCNDGKFAVIVSLIIFQLILSFSCPYYSTKSRTRHNLIWGFLILTLILSSLGMQLDIDLYLDLGIDFVLSIGAALTLTFTLTLTLNLFCLCAAWHGRLFWSWHWPCLVYLPLDIDLDLNIDHKLNLDLDFLGGVAVHQLWCWWFGGLWLVPQPLALTSWWPLIGASTPRPDLLVACNWFLTPRPDHLVACDWFLTPRPDRLVACDWSRHDLLVACDWCLTFFSLSYFLVLLFPFHPCLFSFIFS